MYEYFIYSLPGRPEAVKTGCEIANHLRDLFKTYKKTDPERAEIFRKAANFASNLPKHGRYGLEISGQRKKADPDYLKGPNYEFRRLIVYSFVA
jgi:hypothetical protein